MARAIKINNPTEISFANSLRQQSMNYSDPRVAALSGVPAFPAQYEKLLSSSPAITPDELNQATHIITEYERERKAHIRQDMAHNNLKNRRLRSVKW